MNMRNKLTAHILMGLSLATLSCWSFADKLDNQSLPTNTALEQTEQLDAFVAWDDKLKSILTEQLVANGFDEKEMAADADAVNTIKDKAEFAKAKIGFYSKYQTLALQGLRGVAALAKSVEADTVITNMANVLKANPGIPEGGVPGSISFIYEQIAVSVLELGDSPCITPMTRLGCLFALLTNKECAYIPPASTPANIIPEAWRFPASFLTTGYSEGAWTDDPLGTAHQLTSNIIRSSGVSIVTSAPPVGFRWPLRRIDHTMCVEMALDGENLGYPASVLSVVSARVPDFGYARATAAWSMTLNGYGTFRAGQPLSDCSFSHEVTSDTFSADALHHIFASPRSRACWFNRLEEIYTHTLASQPFPTDPSDPDTWSAASVDITSNASVSGYGWGLASQPRGWIDMTLSNFGVLVVRDR